MVSIKNKKTNRLLKMKILNIKDWISRNFLLISLYFIVCANFNIHAQEEFKVVLDAGHGGKDPGNLGNNYSEKNIVIKIVLAVGELLEKDTSIKVIYTRKDDSFVELDERGNIAQREKADLFVSVHCDAFHNPEASGIGTFVLGLHENERNFEIAQRENSAILMEDNYEQRYKGFDPNSPEAIIGLTLMQEEFLDQSLSIASLLQENFVNDLNRKDRLVKQAGFLVLRNTFMPSVLIETGFLTNKKEGAYLNSKSGQQKIAQSIYKAIIKYKKNIDENIVVEEIPVDIPVTIEKKSRIFEGVEFKVQIASSSKKVELKSYNFKGLKEVDRSKIGSHYKYYFGSSTDYDEILKFKEKAKKKGFPSAFVVAFKNKERISLSEILDSP